MEQDAALQSAVRNVWMFRRVAGTWYFGVIVNELGPHQPSHLLGDAFLDPSNYFDVIDITPVISVEGQFPDIGDVAQVVHIPRSILQLGRIVSTSHISVIFGVCHWDQRVVCTLLHRGLWCLSLGP